jgi:perosamine synthetase
MQNFYRQACDELICALHEVLGNPLSPMSLHEPEFAGNEWTYVKECIDTGWVSSVGKFVDGFERQLVQATGARHAVAVANGTAALHMALLLAGVDRGDEVLVPAMSFVGTANSVAHAGAVPHFVDSESGTLGMDPRALRAHLDQVAQKTTGGLLNRLTGRRIAAIVPMHAFGHPVDLEGLLEVAANFGLPVVEDAAESLGSTYKGQHTGTFGLLGILSFNGNKVITTGGGGAILTNDEALARRAKHLTTTAKRPHRWAFVHDEVAYNYRMPNINAALGCAQLERLPDFLSRKRHLAQRYRKVFSESNIFDFVDQPGGCESNFWLVAIRLRQPNAELRDLLLAAVNDAGYQCRPVWTLLNKLPMYLDCPRAALPVAQAIEDSLINLPSSPKLAQSPQ